MQTKKKLKFIQANEIGILLTKHYPILMAAFYELQSSFISGVYKKYGSIETANIILCFAKNIHLKIIRQKEYNLYHDVSLENFWDNLFKINNPYAKITNVVEETSIPKETVRRKLKKLMKEGLVTFNKENKSYNFNLLLQHREEYLKSIENEIDSLSKFVFNFAKFLNLNIDKKIVQEEIKSHFSFYWYHFLSCELTWFKMWQEKFQDNDMILIALQATIPSLQYQHKVEAIKNLNLKDLYKVVGDNDNNKITISGISAASISEITGIPRATCIRKLEKLVSYGYLTKEIKSKRFFLNQNTPARTKNIVSKNNVDFTIKEFSETLSIILNGLISNRNIY